VNAVRYAGGTAVRSAAEAIAAALGVTAMPAEIPVTEPAELLLIGCQDGTMTPALRHLLSTADPAMIKSAAMFQASAVPWSCWQEAAAILADRGIRMRPEEFSCRRELLFLNRGHPDRRDLSAAGKWAGKLVQKQS